MPRALEHRRVHAVAVPLLVLLAGVLAVTSLRTDSVTFDETSHLTAGYAALRFGDFRLAPDHPPLAKMWCAVPLLLLRPAWIADDSPHWISANTFFVGRAFLFELNDGQRLVVAGRMMMVVLLLATLLAIYGVGRQIFGPAAGLLALTLAAFSPTLLAHGRLVTTDLPITLAVLLAVWAFARLMERLTWPRVALAALALSAAALVKMSWPLALPALLVMALLAILRCPPGALRLHLRAAAQKNPSYNQRAASVAAVLGVLAVTTWAGIWTGYRWRYAMLAPLPAGATPAAQDLRTASNANLALAWQIALRDEHGVPRTGVVPAVLNVCANLGLLPDAYLLGLAQTLASTSRRSAYLMGEYSTTGWRTYFPIAFAIKTPIAVLGLLIAGIAGLALRRLPVRRPVLAAGLATFAVVYAVYVVMGNLNIGHRHLLPVYPIVFVLAGAAAAWLASRVGRVLVGLALVWLLIGTSRIHPQYLSYFNEVAGGPANGWKWLADSNVDWGQDLLRLARHARETDCGPIRLAYFGSAVPTYYLPGCTSLPSFIDFEPRAELTAGTYVLSVNQALGVADIELRDAFWQAAEVQRGIRMLAAIAAEELSPDATAQTRERHAQARRELAELRYRWFVNRLSHRPPDERVGHSLLVHHLTPAEVEALRDW